MPFLETHALHIWSDVAAHRALQYLEHARAYNTSGWLVVAATNDANKTGFTPTRDHVESMKQVLDQDQPFSALAYRIYSIVHSVDSTVET
eukprot:3143377-Pleurochrysis_carterae.AAC.2